MQANLSWLLLHLIFNYVQIGPISEAAIVAHYIFAAARRASLFLRLKNL
jgi:hypothetical protein